MAVNYDQKLPGLTSEKWFKYQLKQIQPHIKSLWSAFTSDTLTDEQVKDIITHMTKLIGFFVKASDTVENNQTKYSADFLRFMTVLRSDNEVSLDFLKLIAAYYCVLARRDVNGDGCIRSDVLWKITASLFKISLPAIDGVVDSTVAETDTYTVYNGNFGSFINADTLLAENMNIAVALLRSIYEASECSELVSSPSGLAALLSFSCGFFSSTVLPCFEAFANRKKLYLLVCLRLVPVAVCFFTNCRRGHFNAAVSEQQERLRRAVCSVLSVGLLDDKHVDDLCTLKLLSAVPDESTKEDVKPNKKQRTDTPSAKKAACTDNATSAKGSASFYVSLFQVLFDVCHPTASSTESVSSDTGLAAAQRLVCEDKAFAVAQLLDVFAERSARRALDQKKAETGRGYGKSVSVKSEVATLDAAANRKHVLRVLHFAFLLLEQLKERPTSDVLTGGNGNSSMKRKLASCSETGDSCGVATTVVYGTIRNHVLLSLSAALDGHALPTHDSMRDFSARLKVLSAGVSGSLEALHGELCELLSKNTHSDVAHQRMKEIQSLCSLDLDCFRVLACIDHSAVVEPLEPAMRLLLRPVVFLSHSETAPSSSKRKASGVSSQQYSSWVWLVQRKLNMSASEMYRLVVAESANCAAGCMAVDDSVHDALSAECIGGYRVGVTDTTVTELLRSTVSRIAPEASLSESDWAQFAVALRVYHSQYILCRLVLAVHTQLRTLDSLVQALCAAETDDDSRWSDVLLSGEIFASQEMQRLMARAFSAVPSGQVPVLWAGLSAAKTREQQYGSVASSLLRAFVNGQSQAVRSSIQQLSEYRSSESDANSAVSHMVAILGKLIDTVRHCGELVSSASPDSAVLFVAERRFCRVLSTASQLARYATQRFSAAVNQLLVPVVVTSSSAGEDGSTPRSSVSFHALVTTVLLGLVDPWCHNRDAAAAISTACLDVLLAAALLDSNVQAKYRPDRRMGVSTAREVGPAVGSMLVTLLSRHCHLELLVVLLRNIHIWLQFCGEANGIIGAAELIPLLRSYVRGTVSGNEDRVSLSAVGMLLHSAAVIDCPTVQGAMSAALTDEWTELTSESGRKTKKSKISTVETSGGAEAVTKFITAVATSTPRQIVQCSSDLVAGLFSHLMILLSRPTLLSVADATTVQYIADIVLAFISHEAEEHSVPSVVSGSEHRVLNRLLCALSAEDREAALESQLDAFTRLVAACVTASRSSSSGCNPLDSLVCIGLDCWVSFLASAGLVDDSRASALLEKLIRSVTQLQLTALAKGTTDSAECLTVRRFFHAVVSAVIQAAKGGPGDSQSMEEATAWSLHASIAALIEDLLSRGADAIADDAFFCLADCLAVTEALHSWTVVHDASQIDAFRQTTVPKLVNKLLDCVGGWLAASDSDESFPAQPTEGWFYLFNALTPQVAYTLGVATVVSTEQDAVCIDTSALTQLCEILRAAAVRDVDYRVQLGEAVDLTPSVHISTCLVHLLTAVVGDVLRAKLCNCDSSEVFNIVFSIFVKELLATAALDDGMSLRSRRIAACVAGVAQDTLLYFTKGSAGLGGDGGKTSVFTEAVLRAVQDTFTVLAARQPPIRTIAGAVEVQNLLERIQTVTEVLGKLAAQSSRHASVNKRGRQKEQARTQKDQASDSAANTVARFTMWCDGLLHFVSTLSLKVRMFAVAASVPPGADATRDQLRLIESQRAEEAQKVVLLNRSVVEVVRCLLVSLERVVSVSIHSSLSNLNTNVHNVVSLVGGHVHTLIRLENSIDRAPMDPTEILTGNQKVVAVARLACCDKRDRVALEAGLGKCYHLVARILSDVASSRDLERHANLVAAVFVDQLAKERVSKAFQGSVYPGLFALFEKCKLRQKNQMFALLDAQARALMTDVHSEYLRTFKFVGK